MTKNNLNKVNLITGGAGFLGSHLIDRLMKKGEEVICIDNFFTGTKKTEFPELPEIGDLKLEDGKATAAITAGLLINPNQKAQAQIIQSNYLQKACLRVFLHLVKILVMQRLKPCRHMHFGY